jgi:predicted GNAT superfamily acetyltransferase
MSIVIEQISEISGCKACHEVASRVWGEDAVCSIPQMLVHALYGGVVLLARDDARDNNRDGGLPIGFVFSFPALYQGNWVLWSHETAVLPEYLHLGIGTRLKLEQWRIGAQMPFQAVAWTFDPLISRNAHFNLNKLHAQISEYKVNAYGVMEDLINKSLETDRFIAVWPFQRQALPKHAVDAVGKVEMRSQVGAYTENVSTAGTTSTVIPFVPVMLDLVENPSQPGFPLPVLNAFSERAAQPEPGVQPKLNAFSESGAQLESGVQQDIETRIPLDMETVVRENLAVAAKWRGAFREAALALFRNGYHVQSFERREKCGVYIWRSSKWQSGNLVNQ